MQKREVHIFQHPAESNRQESCFRLDRPTPPGFHSSSIFPFPTSSWSLSPRHSLPPSCCRLPTRGPNAKHSFARGCSLQGCRGAGEEPAFLFSFFSSFPLLPLSLAPRLRRDAFSFLFLFAFLFSLFATPSLFFSFFLIFLSFFFFFFLFLYFFFLLIFPFFFLFFSSFCFFLPIQHIQYFPAFFFLSLFFLLLLFYLSCLQSISCSPFLPVLFFFFYSTHFNLSPVHRQHPPSIPFFSFFFSFFIPIPYSPSCSACLSPAISFFSFFFSSFPPPSPPSSPTPLRQQQKEEKKSAKEPSGRK